jgi:hypothetical protein
MLATSNNKKGVCEMGTVLAVGIALTLLTGSAFADTVTCPDKSTIKQSALSGGGFKYSAPGPNQRMWRGKNEYADDHYLAAVDFRKAAFKDTAFKSNSEAVICSYKGKGNAVVKLSLKPFTNWQAVAGTDWRKQQCVASSAARCSFRHTP